MPDRQGGYASAQSLRHPGQPFLCTLHELLQTPACSAPALHLFVGKELS
jgi:hypothetical protein